MRQKCRNCDKNCENGDLCFKCKPRKPFPKIRKGTLRINGEEITQKEAEQGLIMREFFLYFWKTRPIHNCENCGKWLGSEPLSYMFDHLLEKSKYPELKYEPINICYLCLECHDNKTRGFISEKIQNLINKVKEMFGK